MAHTGIVLINTGTPNQLTEDAIRDFLRNMLSDPMLISCPPVIWKRVLKYFILPNRPKRTINNYERMWDEDGSVFMRVSNRQADAVAAELHRRGFAGGDFEVYLAMRYCNPPIMDAIRACKAHGCGHIVAVPLYPQYVNVCAGTCLKEVARCVGELRDDTWNPQMNEVRSFYEWPSYQQALAESVRQRWTYTRGAKLLMSFHSTLMADIEAGDPYREQCQETMRDLATRLGVPDGDCQTSYQSRFDSRKWLQPFTCDALAQWAKEGVEDVCIVCPGFVAENIESKIEAGEQLRDMFLEAAPDGARYTYIPALDDAPGLINAIADAVEAA